MTCSLILLSSTLVKTLLCTDRSVIPRQLLHLALSPFFDIFISRPHLQSFGISPSFHILSNKAYSMFAVMFKSTFITSGEILLTPAAFPFCNSFSAFFISTTVGTLVLILKFFSYSSSSSACLSKEGFKILEESSCQCFGCSSVFLRRVPSLFLILSVQLLDSKILSQRLLKTLSHEFSVFGCLFCLVRQIIYIIPLVPPYTSFHFSILFCIFILQFYLPRSCRTYIHFFFNILPFPNLFPSLLSHPVFFVFCFPLKPNTFSLVSRKVV